MRKHATFLIAFAVYNFVLFFPIIFLGRVVSPNDVYYNFEPWQTYRPASVLDTQNNLLNDPPTAYYTLISLLKDEPRAFHWNPYIASGIPGFGSAGAAVLSPFILLPALFVPLTWVYTAILFLKLNAALLFAYLWLREERLGNRAAAIGAIVVAGSGIYAVRWLWQLTNATALYPLLLLLVRRAFNRKRTPIWLITLIALAYALAGFPAAMACGVYLALAYAIFLAIRLRRFPAMRIGEALVAAAIAIAIALPSLIPFIQLVRRTGYLGIRKEAAQISLPASHWRSFIAPDRLGSPARKDWVGDRRALGPLNNYIESTIYIGAIAIPLVLLALMNRRTRTRWFWIAATAVVLAIMFGAPVIAPIAATVPGIKYSWLTRVNALLPVTAGYLAAAGAAWLLSFRRMREVIAGAIAIAVAYDLALFAGRFYPYLDSKDAGVPSTPTIDFLRSERGPFRVAPFFIDLWPNSAELFRIEDIRSHFSSEATYRRLMQRIDPSSWDGTSTVLQFNSLNFNFDDPVVGMLGVRWYLEQNSIDIIKWKTFAATKPGVKEIGYIAFKPGALLRRTIKVMDEPFWAIEIPTGIDGTSGAEPRIIAMLAKDGRVVWSRAITADDIRAISKFYIPLRPYARRGETVTVTLRSHGITGNVLKGEGAARGDTALFYGRVTTPVIFDRQLPDGRLFRNLSEVPRFHPVSRLRKLNDDEFFADRAIDLAEEAVITDDPVMPPDVHSPDARVTLTRYAPAEQRLVTESSVPFFLASSEKLTPELRVTIDGRAAKCIEINTLFAGVVIPAGRHEVIFLRRLAPGWWWVAGVGVFCWLIVAALEFISYFRMRGNTSRR